jgi:hypothetical protein
MIDRPEVTMVRVATSRIPSEARPRLARLAARAIEVYNQQKKPPPLQLEIAEALSVALLDVELNERRAESAEGRARRAELDRSVAIRQVAVLVRELEQLQAQQQERDEFSTSEPTALRVEPHLINQCKVSR